jgi:hypothetical protein
MDLDLDIRVNQYVRSEYCTHVWSSHDLKDISLIDNSAGVCMEGRL